MIQIDTVLLVASLPALELCCLHPLLLLGRVPLHGCCLLLPQRWWCSSLINTWKQNMIGPVKAWLSTYCLTSLNCFCIHRKSYMCTIYNMYIICTFKLTARHQTAVAVAAAAVLDTLEETLLDQFMRSNGYLCHVWRPCFLLSLSSSRISGGSHAPNCSALAEIGGDRNCRGFTMIHWLNWAVPRLPRFNASCLRHHATSLLHPLLTHPFLLLLSLWPDPAHRYAISTESYEILWIVRLSLTIWLFNIAMENHHF